MVYAPPLVNTVPLRTGIAVNVVVRVPGILRRISLLPFLYEVVCFMTTGYS